MRRAHHIVFFNLSLAELFLAGLLLANLFLPTPAAAASGGTPLEGMPADSVSLDLTSDGMAGLALGYAHRFDDALLSRPVLVRAVLTTPLMVIKDADSARILAGASTPLVHHGSFVLTGNLAATLTTAGNDLGSFVSLGSELMLVPALRFERWQIGALAGVRMQHATRIAHAAYAKDAFTERYGSSSGPGTDDGPEDGWYGSTATRFVFGLDGGVALGERVSIDAAAGLVFTHQPFDIVGEGMIGLLPFFARVGVSWYF